MDIKTLNEIKARCKKATHGPWEYSDCAREIWNANGIGIIEGTEDEGISISKENADFIAHSRIDIPALLAEVERLTAKCSTLKTISEIHKQNLVILANRVNVWDKALEMMYLDNKDYNPYGMKNPTYYIQQAQKQEEKK